MWNWKVVPKESPERITNRLEDFQEAIISCSTLPKKSCRIVSFKLQNRGNQCLNGSLVFTERRRSWISSEGILLEVQDTTKVNYASYLWILTMMGTWLWYLYYNRLGTTEFPSLIKILRMTKSWCHKIWLDMTGNTELRTTEAIVSWTNWYAWSSTIPCHYHPPNPQNGGCPIESWQLVPKLNNMILGWKTQTNQGNIRGIIIRFIEISISCTTEWHEQIWWLNSNEKNNLRPNKFPDVVGTS